MTTGAGAAYTIGMMPLLPEAYHDLPEQYAAYRYWAKEKDTERRDEFKSMWMLGASELGNSYGINDLTMVLDSGLEEVPPNPNLTITI